MVDVRALTGPPPELLFKRRIRPGEALAELWRSRELIRTLAERELRVRYKQALLGFAWAVVTPLVMMVVFTLFFQRVATVDTRGAPYALFCYLGLLPWTFFSSSLSQGGTSLVANTHLLNKLYCPREVFPIAYVFVAGMDTVLASLALVVLFAVTGFMPAGTSAFIPVLLVVLVMFTLANTLVFSALIVYLRDFRHTLPILLQLGLFATPVAYGLDAIPENLRLAYCALNPLAPVIDGLRRVVLYGQPPAWDLLAAGAVTSTIFLILGYIMFKRLETNFADVA
jgi:ABC-type polysaccharide/polyol phosphate export permease